MSEPSLHLEALVVEEPPQALLGLGQTLAFNGVEAVVGVARDHPQDPLSGRVYLFQRQNDAEVNKVEWVQQEAWIHQHEDGTKDERFGTQLALRGSILLVSAAGNNRTGNRERGEVHVFEKNEKMKWERKQVLQEPTTNSATNFGACVDTDGTRYIVVAALSEPNLPPHGDNRIGIVYTYVKGEDDRWECMHALEPPPQCTHGCNFASSLALRGEILLVSGKQGQDGDNRTDAEAYVYHWSGEKWDLENVLIVREGIRNFGQQLALSTEGNMAAIATTSTRPGETAFTGIIQVFSRGNPGIWTEGKKLETSLPQGTGFGTALSISERTLVVGAYKFGNSSKESGAAFVYILNDEEHWSLPFKLEPDVPTTNQHFGASVSTEKNLILVGAPSDVAKGPNGGAVYAYCLGSCEHLRSPSDVVDLEESIDPADTTANGRGAIAVPVLVAIVLAASSCLLLLLFLLYRKRKVAMQIRNSRFQTSLEDLNLRSRLEGKTTFFSVDALEQATNNFDASGRLCQTACTEVYKGTLVEGTVVAIKKLTSLGMQTDHEFYQEVDILSRIRHPNLVRLFGCCIDNGERMLVYQLMEKGSLDNLLPELSWQELEKAAVGTAKGLAYIHGVIQPRIVHGHLKSSEILLDAMLEAHVSDFRFSHFHPEDGDSSTFSFERYSDAGILSHRNNRAEVQPGHGTSIETDVYSYGMILFELLALPNPVEGQLINRSSPSCCLDLSIEEIQHYHRTIRGGRLSSWPTSHLKTMLDVARRCLMQDPLERPHMREIVQWLTDETV